MEFWRGLGLDNARRIPKRCIEFDIPKILSVNRIFTGAKVAPYANGDATRKRSDRYDWSARRRPAAVRRPPFPTFRTNPFLNRQKYFYRAIRAHVSFGPASPPPKNPPPSFCRRSSIDIPISMASICLDRCNGSGNSSFSKRKREIAFFRDRWIG